MRCLAALTEPNGHYSRTDSDSEREDEFNFGDNETVEDATAEYVENADDPDPYVAFIANVHGMNGWFFRPGDPDPWPSVPHGHWENKPSPKLNPYTSRAYDNNHNEVLKKRLSRKTMVALWNDSKFREGTLKSIDYYVLEFPTHQFNIRHYRRLPRRR
jgi:hypothetical protein